MPLSVAVALVSCGDELLFIRRARGSYAGRWALPGGKIEDDEHVSDAVRREIREEAGLETTFAGHRGIVSEHLRENGRLNAHFLLHVCALSAPTRAVTPGDEGTLRWVDAPEAAEVLDLLPSDRAMLHHYHLDGATGYRECVMENDGDTYRLHSFG